jgi:alginate O-acetyltransferase complex protein AlgJ
MSRTNTIRITFAILAIAFFATPIGLRAVGVTAEEFENRRLADAPKAAQGWDAFQQTSRYLVDRMPLRAQAVRANTRIWTDVFGDDAPYARDTALAKDQALPFAGRIEHAGDDTAGGQEIRGLRDGPATASSGRSGWLYIPLEFSVACDESIPNDLVLRRWAKLVRAVGTDGRKTAMFVAPDKGSVYPEHLPEKYPDDHCALAAKERFWRLLSSAGPALGVFELRSELLRLKSYAGDGLFQRKDSHWSTLGALSLVRAALEKIGGGVRLKPSEIVDRGTVSYVGNLTVVDGRGETDTRQEYGIRRAPDAPLVPGRTLIVGDSFAYKWMRLFRPYFENLREVSWYKGASRIAEEIRQADTVIIESEEISTKTQAGDNEVVEQLIRDLHAG